MMRSELRSALEGWGEGGAPVGQLQSLIAQRMQRAQELLEEMRLQVGWLRLRLRPAASNAGSDPQELQKARAEREPGGGSAYLKSLDSPRLHHLRGSDSAHSGSVPEGAAAGPGGGWF